MSIKNIFLIHSLILQSSNFAPWNPSKWVETFCPHKNMPMETYSSFLSHCQNLKGIKMSSVGERTNELWYIETMKWHQPWKGMKNHQCLLLSEITNLRNTHAMSTTAWHFAKGKLRTVTQSDFFFYYRGGGKINRQSKYFVWCYNLLQNTLDKFLDHTAPRWSLNINCLLWVTICQCRFIIYNKDANPVGNDDSWAADACAGGRI